MISWGFPNSEDELEPNPLDVGPGAELVKGYARYDAESAWSAEQMLFS